MKKQEIRKNKTFGVETEKLNENKKFEMWVDLRFVRLGFN